MSLLSPLKTTTGAIDADTTGYIYFDMDASPYLTLQADVTVSTDTLTLTWEASVQDDGTAIADRSYKDVTQSLFGVANVVDSDAMFIIDTPVAFKSMRLKYVTSDTGGDDATLITYAHKRELNI